MQDLRYGLRMLGRAPGFTAVALLTLALGIGATTMMFSIIRAVLLHPLPYADPERVVFVASQFEEAGVPDARLSGPELVDLRQHVEAFDGVAALVAGSYTLTGEGEPEQPKAVGVSANFFATVGVRPLLGRTFLPEEEGPDVSNVVLLSHGFWQRRFGGDPKVLDRAILLDGKSFRIVGVLPPEFSFLPPDPQFPDNPEIWAAMPFEYGKLKPTWRLFYAIARLKGGRGVESAQAEVTAVARSLAEQHPDVYRDKAWGLSVTPLQEHLVKKVRPAVLLLFGAGVLVLLIACTNVASLVLVRTSSRLREFAVRNAMGAHRGRMVRQLLIEQTLLAGLGGVLGVLLAYWGLRALVALSPGDIPRLGDVRLDGASLAFTVLACALTALLLGLFPLVQIAPSSAWQALRERSGPPAGLRRLHGTLVVVEVALALVLVIATGLTVRSFLNLQKVDPGFRPEKLLALRLELRRTQYPKTADRVAFFQEVSSRIAALPGVKSVNVVSHLPFSEAYWLFPVEVVGRETPPDEVEFAELQSVTHGYFEQMGIPLLKGRLFTASDSQDAPGVAVIDEVLARRLFPGEEPLGRKVRTQGSEHAFDVVGVVRHIKLQSLDAEDKGQLYFAYPQNPKISAFLTIRATVEPASLVGPVRQRIRALDRDLPISDVATLEERIQGSLARARFQLLLFAIFGAVSLILAAVGIYGVLSFLVTQRTQEMGVRLALGARRSNVLWLMVDHGLRLTLLGIGIGLAGAAALARLLSSLLYGVTSHDLLTFISVPVVVAAVALAATYLPARRASRVSPLSALRHDG